MYYGKDSNNWTIQVEEKGYLQQRCFPPDSSVVQFKVNTFVNAPIEICLKCGCDYEVRKLWDDVLYDFRIFEQTPD